MLPPALSLCLCCACGAAFLAAVTCVSAQWLTVDWSVSGQSTSPGECCAGCWSRRRRRCRLKHMILHTVLLPWRKLGHASWAMAPFHRCFWLCSILLCLVLVLLSVFLCFLFIMLPPVVLATTPSTQLTPTTFECLLAHAPRCPSAPPPKHTRVQMAPSTSSQTRLRQRPDWSVEARDRVEQGQPACHVDTRVVATPEGTLNDCTYILHILPTL